MKKIFALLLAAMLALTAACGGSGTAAATPTPETAPDTQQTQTTGGTSAPAADGVELSQAKTGDVLADFTMTDMDGTKRALSDYRGKAVLVTMWATWCGYCREEMPEFQTLKETYGDDLTVLALDVDMSDEDDAKSFVADAGYDFVYAMDTEGVGDFVSGIPFSFVVSTDGTLLYTQSGSAGSGTVSAFTPYIEQALGR